MHTNRRGHGALILVVLLGLAIILIMMFAGGNHSYMNQVNQTRKQGKQMVKDIETGQLTTLIAQYRQENNGKLPTSWEEIESAPRELYAPYGKPMTFKFETDKKTGKTYVFYHSDGPDGEPNTGDEIDRKDTLPF
jgi:predicted PurR-regulated permease PerM